MVDRELKVYAVGVGGFGIGSLSQVLSTAAFLKGMEAVGSETHGLAQRGGAVVSTLRLGHNLTGSPLLIKGSADILVALEPLEALRSLGYLRPGGAAIYNTSMIQPLAVRIRAEEYPPLVKIEAEIKRATDNVIAIDASAMAKELGFAQVMNMILLGRLVREKALPFDMATIQEAVKQNVSARFHEVNLKALEMG